MIINCITDHRLVTRLCTVQARTFAPSSATASCPDFAVDAGIWPSNLPQTADDAHHYVFGVSIPASQAASGTSPPLPPAPMLLLPPGPCRQLLPSEWGGSA